MLEEPPLVARHDTWVSLDPVVGCPASCSYCYLQATHLVGVRPLTRCTPEAALEALVRHFAEPLGASWAAGTSPVPVALGNATDLLNTDTGRSFLRAYLPLHAARFPEHPLILITKARISEDMAAELDRFGHRILVFLSQSYLHDVGLGAAERGPVSSSTETTHSARALFRTSNLSALHYWRPLVPATAESLEDATARLRSLRVAGVVATVAIGLKVGQFLTARGEQNRLILGDQVPGTASEALDVEVEQRILQAGRAAGHPVYRHTSCAVAYALGLPEALGTWRPPFRSTRCLPSSCPDRQRNLCAGVATADRDPSGVTLAEIAAAIGAPDARWNDVKRTVDVDVPLSQEQQTRLLHRFGQRVVSQEYSSTRAWLGAFT